MTSGVRQKKKMIFTANRYKEWSYYGYPKSSESYENIFILDVSEYRSRGALYCSILAKTDHRMPELKIFLHNKSRIIVGFCSVLWILWSNYGFFSASTNLTLLSYRIHKNRFVLDTCNRFEYYI